jgi:hypothetical protein
MELFSFDPEQDPGARYTEIMHGLTHCYNEITSMDGTIYFALDGSLFSYDPEPGLDNVIAQYDINTSRYSRLNLTPLDGSLYFASDNGIGVFTPSLWEKVDVTGEGTDTLTLTGTVDQINAALETLSFTSASDFNGTATLTVETSDLGWSGAGSQALTAQDSISIEVAPVNDAPVVEGWVDPPARDVNFGYWAYDVSAYFHDVDGDSLQYEMQTYSGALLESVYVDSNGVIHFSSAPDMIGSEKLYVRAYDGVAYSDYQEFMFAVA